MRITGVQSMRLVGPREHALGGHTGAISKMLVRVDTDVGLYGLGEADAFLGVIEGISYISEYIKGRDPLHVRPLVSELLYGSLPPHHRLAPEGLLSSGHFACAAMSPTATAYGPIVWAASGVEMALCDLVGKALDTPVSTLLGGRFRDRVRVYLDRSAPAQVEEESAWIDLAATALDQGFTQMKFDIDYMEGTMLFWFRKLTHHCSGPSRRNSPLHLRLTMAFSNMVSFLLIILNLRLL